MSPGCGGEDTGSVREEEGPEEGRTIPVGLLGDLPVVLVGESD